MALTTYRSEACTPHQWGSFEQLWQLHIAGFVALWEHQLFTVLQHDLNMSWNLSFQFIIYYQYILHITHYIHAYASLLCKHTHTHTPQGNRQRGPGAPGAKALTVGAQFKVLIHSVTMVCVTWLFSHTHRHYIIVHIAGPLYSMICGYIVCLCRPILLSQNSLQVLIEKMNAASPHFVRCIKPNTAKVAILMNTIWVNPFLPLICYVLDGHRRLLRCISGDAV